MSFCLNISMNFWKEVQKRSRPKDRELGVIDISRIVETMEYHEFTKPSSEIEPFGHFSWGKRG